MMTTKKASHTPCLTVTKAEGEFSEEQLEKVAGGWPIDWGPVKTQTTSSSPSISEIVVTKRIDSSSLL